MYPVCVSLFLCLSPLNMYVLLSESTLVTKPNELENYILSWCLWNHILVLILGLAHNIQVEGDGIDQISRHQILLLFPDHHHYHSFIIKGSDKTTNFRPHHASFRQILKYPINFLSESKIVSENCGRTDKFKCVKTLIYPQWWGLSKSKDLCGVCHISPVLPDIC